MCRLHVLRVFVDEEGRWGNPLGVFLEGRAVPASERQRIAADLGYSESVFLDDPATGAVAIFTPTEEIPFAGHPLVGIAWLLAREGAPAASLRPAAGEVRVGKKGEMTTIAAPGEWSPFTEVELGSAAEVDSLSGSPSGASGDVYAWAWIDRAAGTVRARSFAPDFGIPEDEATGSAALGLAVSLGRDLTIRQGRGSLLIARSLEGGRGEVGGRVVLDRSGTYPLSDP